MRKVAGVYRPGGVKATGRSGGRELFAPALAVGGLGDVIFGSLGFHDCGRAGELLVSIGKDSTNAFGASLSGP